MNSIVPRSGGCNFMLAGRNNILILLYFSLNPEEWQPASIIKRIEQCFALNRQLSLVRTASLWSLSIPLKHHGFSYFLLQWGLLSTKSVHEQSYSYSLFAFFPVFLSFQSPFLETPSRSCQFHPCSECRPFCIHAPVQAASLSMNLRFHTRHTSRLTTYTYSFANVSSLQLF